MAVKLKDVKDLDVAALDAVEYSTEEFTSYAGEVPPVGIELTGYVKRLWWTRTNPKPNGGGDDPMLKVLWVAADNDGEYEEYNDCPFWLNAPLVPGAKFRWAPFLDVYGLTLQQIKSNTFIAQKEDQNGAPIERIGQWKPGEESDAAWCRIITGQEPYQGEMQARVKEWLMWDAEPDGEGTEPDGEEPDGDGEEVELFEDADGNLVDAEGNFYNEDGTLMEEPEEPEEPEPPARTRRTTAKAAPARAARTASTAPATRSAATAPARSAKAAPATTRTRSAAPARPAQAAKAAPARSGRGRAAAAQNDPPF